MTQRILILGGTSAIAKAVASRLVSRGEQVAVAGRDLDELNRTARDLEIRSRARVSVVFFEATDFGSFEDVYEASTAALGGELDGVLSCHGFMKDDVEVRKDWKQVQRTVDVNLTSAICFAEIAARRFEARGSGWIAAVSSVAGDRGRQSNYVYGASKAGLTAYLQGLRNRLCASGVHVLTIQPGFVYTALTQGLLDPASPLVAQPERVAKDIVEAIDRRRNVLYTPWFWRWIMMIIRTIPEAIFKRLKL